MPSDHPGTDPTGSVGLIVRTVGPDVQPCEMRLSRCAQCGPLLALGPGPAQSRVCQPCAADTAGLTGARIVMVFATESLPADWPADSPGSVSPITAALLGDDPSPRRRLPPGAVWGRRWARDHGGAYIDAGRRVLRLPDRAWPYRPEQCPAGVRDTQRLGGGTVLVCAGCGLEGA